MKLVPVYKRHANKYLLIEMTKIIIHSKKLCDIVQLKDRLTRE